MTIRVRRRHLFSVQFSRLRESILWV